MKPKYQRQGIGKALILEGHKIAKRLGYPYSLVLGSNTYYPKVGYIPAERFNIEVPNGISADNFMAINLQEKAKPIGGKVIYAKEFGI
ncbi:putative acetyltransferase [Christensenella hongkongensis]|uniref:Putative acetyltransferase n=1 Tax=Christensenella hongkongensis TaxID=270498 RepID=A0A0M2NHZ5_9FIRM|nr:putative acetyltransferase [Christensenella hongkongensis]